MTKAEKEQLLDFDESHLDAIDIGAAPSSLVRAGFNTPRERRNALLVAALISSPTLITAGYLGACRFGIPGFVAGIAVGGYVSAIVGALLYRLWRTKVEREILFSLPLFLEAIILLVDSGCGILPAITTAAKANHSTRRTKRLLRFFHAICRLSENGIPFSEAIKSVSERATHFSTLQHVLLHLDLAASEGVEIGPALRHLSDYAHSEWKMAVEERVKRLEHFVVFPVFISVMGLLALMAAGPLVSVLDLRGHFASQPTTAIVNREPTLSR